MQLTRLLFLSANMRNRCINIQIELLGLRARAQAASLSTDCCSSDETCIAYRSSFNLLLAEASNEDLEVTESTIRKIHDAIPIGFSGFAERLEDFVRIFLWRKALKAYKLRVKNDGSIVRQSRNLRTGRCRSSSLLKLSLLGTKAGSRKQLPLAPNKSNLVNFKSTPPDINHGIIIFYFSSCIKTLWSIFHLFCERHETTECLLSAKDEDEVMDCSSLKR